MNINVIPREKGYMERIYYTLQDFLSHTESVTYILIVGTLIGMAGFWCFLNQRDDGDD